MKIARQISTGKYVNDFQDKATDEVLIASGIAQGMTAEDIEILDVTEEEYLQIVDDILGDIREIIETEELAKEEEKQQILNNVKTALGLTDDQFELFLESLK